jgi:hypothetical protein
MVMVILKENSLAFFFVSPFRLAIPDVSHFLLAIPKTVFYSLNEINLFQLHRVALVVL